MPCGSWLRWLALLLWLLAGAGCVTPPHPYAILPGHTGGGTGQRLLVLPLNVVVSLPAELQAPSKGVAEEIVRYLEESGNSVETLGFYDARSRWLAAVKQVQAAGDVHQDFNSAARVFVEQLAGAKEFDAMLMPNLVYRTAELNQGSSSVSWDGVSREIDVADRPQRVGSIYYMSEFYGTMDGVSLHVYGFDTAGERFFESFGGVDLVHEAHMGDAVTGHHYEMRLKPAPLGNKERLREGIELAFDPYVSAPAQASAGSR